jgi:hypothetical protein
MLSDPAVDLSDPPETPFGWVGKILRSLCKAEKFYEAINFASTSLFSYDTKESVDLILGAYVQTDIISALKFSRKHSGSNRAEDLEIIMDAAFSINF